MFKVVPGKNKIPLISDWQNTATNDAEQIAIWANTYRNHLTHWVVPTGPVNDIFVLDVDVKGNGFETLRTLHVPVTLTQRTPSGGMHLIYRYPRDGRHYGNRVKFLPGLDTRGVGGYIMWYGANDATPITDAPQWLLDAVAREEVKQGGPTYQIEPEIANKMIAESLDRIREAAPGESNNVLNTEAFKMGQLIASSAVTRDFIEATLFRAAKDRGKPDYEARATIKSGLDGGVKKPLASPFGDQPPVVQIQMPPPPPVETKWTPLPFTREELFDVSHLRKPQLFKDWSTEDIAITTADGGTGKTTLKLFEAVCLALGERFLGFECVNPGKTLFITGEDTSKKIGAMIGQILKQMGLALDMPGNAEKVQIVLESIIVKKDADLCLISKDKQGFIFPNPAAFAKVNQAVQEFRPKMIVFDPISSFWGSESALNDMNKAVTKFMSELVEQSNACVEMINHMGKSSSAQKDMSQFAGRGGSGLPSNARVSRVLRPVFEEEFSEMTGEVLEAGQSAMLCQVNKFSDGSPLYNKPFLIMRTGFLFYKKDLTAAKAKEVEANLSDIERIFGFIKSERGSNKYPTLPVLIAHFMLQSNPISEARTKRAVQMLQYMGHMGEKIKQIDNPDQTIKENGFVVTDMDGKEL